MSDKLEVSEGVEVSKEALCVRSVKLTGGLYHNKLLEIEIDIGAGPYKKRWASRHTIWADLPERKQVEVALLEALSRAAQSLVFVKSTTCNEGEVA